MYVDRLVLRGCGVVDSDNGFSCSFSGIKADFTDTLRYMGLCQRSRANKDETSESLFHACCKVLHDMSIPTSKTACWVWCQVAIYQPRESVP